MNKPYRIQLTPEQTLEHQATIVSGLPPDPKKLIDLGYRDSGYQDRITIYYSLEIDDYGGSVRVWRQEYEGGEWGPYYLLPDSVLEIEIPWRYHDHPALKSASRDISLQDALILVLEFHKLRKSTPGTQFA